mgnify:CR=1 FL=1
MKIVVSAGDPSGDVRAGELLRELNSMTGVTVSGLGGDHLRRAGADILYHLDSYSVMGFTEIISSLGRLHKLRRDLRAHILETDPDAVLLVDYPGFNVPLAQWASERGFRVIYYISPQLWAWGSGRVRRIRNSVDLMMTLFRFEVEFYEKRGVRAVWTGHPLADSIPEPLEQGTSGKLALLPGSRSQEVSLLLGPMVEAFGILRREGLLNTASVAVSPGVPVEVYQMALASEGVTAADSVEEALRGAASAVVCSGTATLETAMWGVPFIIAYRTSPLTYLLARLLVRGVRNIGMANLVAGREFARELIQSQVTPGNIAGCTRPLLKEGREREAALKGAVLVREALGPSGSSARAARLIVQEACG